MRVAPRAGGRPRARQLRSERDYRVDGGSAGPPSGSASTALGPRPPPLPFLDFDGSLAVSESATLRSLPFAMIRWRCNLCRFYGAHLADLSFLGRRRPLQSGPPARAHARAEGPSDGAQDQPAECAGGGNDHETRPPCRWWWPLPFHLTERWPALGFPVSVAR